MMLEKKFRALLLLNDNRKYWHHYSVSNGNDLLNDQKCSGSYKYIIARDLQYIGLKDKTKTEIYEGDIVELVHHRPGKIYTLLYLVIFDYGGFCLKRIKGSKDKLFKKDVFISYVRATKDLVLRKEKVVGNCYENPELYGGADVLR